jgi:PhzF family phenazine biosynthesis protein
MKLKLWQVDAFASQPFKGNPAAVVPLDAWLPDETLQAIAEENNLAETAYFVRKDDDQFHLRWFTPTMEVPLCGHATLASAWVAFNELSYEGDTICFETMSGVLEIAKDEGRLAMSLPAWQTESFDAPAELAAQIGAALGTEAPLELVNAPRGAAGTPGLIAVFSEDGVRRAKSSGALRAVLDGAKFNALMATAKGTAPYDFVSRFFAPGMGVDEDPVTGSAHATLTPFWALRLGKNTLNAYQASARGGDILCTDEGERVTLSGTCVLYLRGEIEV